MAEIKDKSIGVILFNKFPRSLKYLILKHRKGHWSFAKGHMESGETPFETAKRELYEEAGITQIEFVSKKILVKESYNFVNKNKVKVCKSVSYFIAGSKTKTVKIDKQEIISYKWCTVKAADKIITFSESKKLLKKADRIVLKYLSDKKF
ncbi:MAG: NUDIX domain-containing protein [Bacteroidota bacterium]|nr:NUDIX domain-containing protein [Bacteroidota bacterium]